MACQLVFLANLLLSLSQLLVIVGSVSAAEQVSSRQFEQQQQRDALLLSEENSFVIKEQQQKLLSSHQKRPGQPQLPQLQQLPPPPSSSASLIPFGKKFAILGNSTTNAHSSFLSSHRNSSPLVAHLGHTHTHTHTHNYNHHQVQSKFSPTQSKQQHSQLQAAPISPHYQQQNILLQQQQHHLNHGGQLFDHQLGGQRKTTGLLEKICIGTSNSLAIQQNKSDQYQNLVERYQNCTYVIGNLEITWLKDEPSGSGGKRAKDLSFLESIREITGYLLIAHVDVERIRMPNLQIIRGRDLFRFNEEHSQEGRAEEFAMILIENQLRQLELPNLREILAGSVGSYNNRNLCHIRTINWDEILNWPMYRSVFVYDGTEPECPLCDPNCQGSCWGQGAEMCQKFSKVSCSPACGNNGRCFGPSHTECCHSYCAGGCTGSNQTDCLACKNFYDDGSCIQECPSMMRYNPSKFLWEPNPKGKYAFGATCVRECPENMLRDSGACVRTCPANKRSFNGECVPCGGPCPKNCQGVELVHSGNIDQLINCTVIEGSITILDESFTGFTETVQASASTSGSGLNGTSAGLASLALGRQPHPVHGNQTGPLNSTSGANNNSNNLNNNNNNNGTLVRHKPMHPSRLEVFRTLREITGYLNIKAKHPDFKDLSYFTNLRTIDGRQTTDMFHTLSITRTSLVSLNLRSLRKIRGGRIAIEENPELCFADTIDWRQMELSRRNEDELSIRNNADGQRCRAHGLQCNEQCARDGCWGPGPDECLSCNNYKVDDYCVANCSSTESLFGFLAYEDPAQARSCKRCHPECSQGCSGTEARHCNRCRNVKDGPYCVTECPSHKYNRNGTCEECDKSCGPDGCTGPSNRLGEGGCNSCAKAVIRPAGALTSAALAGPSAIAAAQQQQPLEVECIRAEEACPEGYYQEYVLAGWQVESGAPKSSSGRPVCRKCHHRCKHCIGMGTHKTVCECAKYVAGEQCEDFCPRDYYADEEARQCVKCSPECNGCFGPTEADCLSCRVYRIYYETSSAPTRASLSSNFSNNCSNNNNSSKTRRPDSCASTARPSVRRTSRTGSARATCWTPTAARTPPACTTTTSRARSSSRWAPVLCSSCSSSFLELSWCA